MILVTPRTVGRAGYGLALRARSITPLLPGVSLPYDLGASPGLRALALSPFVPRRGIVTGLAGLWVHTGRFPSTVVDVLGPRSLNRPDPRPGDALRVRTHVGTSSARELAPGVAVAAVERCCADALRMSAPRWAFGAVHRTVRDGEADLEAIRACLAGSPSSHRGWAPATLQGIAAALGARQAGGRGHDEPARDTPRRDASDARAEAA